MIRLAFIAGLGLTAAACVTAAPGSSSAPNLYRCDGGKSFTAAYDRGGQRVLVTAGGLSRTLPLAISASGARYAAGDSELWGKGDSATLSGFAGGPYDGCVTR
jgi:membrane-bound inhibitor of C-type lysozyme